jgi:hypothetical protein
MGRHPQRPDDLTTPVLDIRMDYWITDDDGQPLDARVTIGPDAIILHSRGGTQGTPNARNTKYGPALRLLLSRLAMSDIPCTGIWVDSTRVQHLPPADRLVLKRAELQDPMAFTLVSRRMQDVGTTRVGPSHGNANRRLRIGLAGSVP